MNDYDLISGGSLMDKVKELFIVNAKVNAAARCVETSRGFERMKALRVFYREADSQIRDAGRGEWGIDPYEVNWGGIFTPIESALWHDIRAVDAVLYPQYPVGRFFVDFGNPVAKVAIECDGARWHRDAKKDASRTKEIEALGWQVYRISGRDCKTDFDEETRQRSAARKFIDQVVAVHHISRRPFVPPRIDEIGSGL